MDNSYYAQFHTSSEVDSIFSQVFGGRLGFCGFESIGPRKWIQETGNGFKYFFFVNTGNNGFSYLPCGAISIDFVPRIVAGRLKIQPKPKNVAVHYSFGSKTRWDWTIDKNRQNFREKVEKIAGESVSEITAWFQKFKTLNDVVGALAHEKAASRPTDFYCYPVMAMAYAFVLARVCRFDEAHSVFEEAIKSRYWDVDLHFELRKLFHAEIQQA